MSGSARYRIPGSARELPITAFARAVRARHDPIALLILCAVLMFSGLIVSQTFSVDARQAAERRFQLRGLGFVTWAALQPVPSMYNFDNRWTVTPGSAGHTGRCPRTGRSNHHVLHVVYLARERLFECGEHTDIRFSSTYRGTTTETTYRLERWPVGRGLTLSPVEEQ